MILFPTWQLSDAMLVPFCGAMGVFQNRSVLKDAFAAFFFAGSVGSLMLCVRLA
jgi:hypothetical protein